MALTMHALIFQKHIIASIVYNIIVHYNAKDGDCTKHEALPNILWTYMAHHAMIQCYITIHVPLSSWASPDSFS